MSRITDFDTADIRFPTSLSLNGSDAMNPDPDYSAAYLRISTDARDGLVGHGFVFTIGRGNDAQVAAIDALRERFVGRDVEELLADMGAVSRDLIHDSQLRWLGPEKGVMHMAVGAVVNAQWDLKAKRAGMPLWELLAGMSPEELVGLVDFRYLTDALTPEEALDILRAAEPGRAARRDELLASGYPAYATTPGWLGYDDAKLARLCGEAVEDGFELIKLKVGADLADDVRRARDRPRGRGTERPDRRRREPAVGGRGGHRMDAGPDALRRRLDRGAHEPRRRARPCGNHPRRGSHPRRDRRAHGQTASCSSRSCRRTRCRCCRSTRPVWPA
jgi:L-fuconate dehydratase